MKSVRFAAHMVVMGLLSAGCPSGGESSDTVVAPAMDDIFVEIQVPIDRDGDGVSDDANADGVPDTELRYYFDDRLLHELCLVADGDSFDDYEVIENGVVIVPRGVTPLSEGQCEPDGIATGPLEDELYPSKWCRRLDCEPSADAGTEMTMTR